MVAAVEPPPRRTRSAYRPRQAEEAAAPALSVEVHFDFASSSFDGSPEMAEVVAWLEENPNGRLVLEGHTDAVGSAGFNLRLSRLRAMAVKEYLVRETGVENRRLQVVGRGKNRLAYSEDDKNRRVRIIGR